MTPPAIPAVPDWRLALEWLPEEGQPEQLILLLHGWSQDATMFVPLAGALRRQFPKAAILAPNAPHPADDGRPGRQWYSVNGIQDEAVWRERVQACVPAVAAWVSQQQHRLGVGPAATALGGFSQGGVLALHTATQFDGKVGRVLAFGARMTSLPAAATRHTTFHLFHGQRDRIFDVQHARQLFEHLGELQGDATLDMADNVGHELHAALVDCALHRLTHHIPLRTWQAALGTVAAPPSTED